MLISTEIQSSKRIVGEEKAIEYIAKAGFDAWDFSMFDMRASDLEITDCNNQSANKWIALAKKLKKVGLDCGIHCNQSHAPFPSFIPDIRSCLKTAIECTAEAGGKICIIHPGNNKSAEENAEEYSELLPFAKDCGVKIATENMYNWDNENKISRFAACATPESFNKHLDLVNDDCFVACLDVGHAEMRGSETSAPEMIKALGSRLQALHLHDNDLWHDSHQIPLSMQIDFASLVKALKEINYKGYFTLEAMEYLKKFDETNIQSGLNDMARAARQLVSMYESF